MTSFEKALKIKAMKKEVKELEKTIQSLQNELINSSSEEELKGFGVIIRNYQERLILDEKTFQKECPSEFVKILSRFHKTRKGYKTYSFEKVGD